MVFLRILQNAQSFFVFLILGTGVTAASISPGIVFTNIERNVDVLGPFNSVKRYIFAALCFLFGKTAQQGAQTTLRAAIDPELKEITGKHYT